MPSMNHQDMIQRSHKRSKALGIEKDQVVSSKILTSVELKSRLSKEETLLEIAKPFTSDLYSYLEDSGFIIVLTDHEGCILYTVGDPEIIAMFKTLNMVPGAYMDEESIGTNAMGTAISEDTPIQITADEHFIKAYHGWTCSAAPIHDAAGKMIGTLNLTGKHNRVHSHTLGLVVAAVKAIENKMRTDVIQKKLYDANHFAFSMMNSLSYGVVAIDMHDQIQWINDTACRIFDIRRSQLINTAIKSLFKDWHSVKRIVSNKLPFIDEEGRFELPGLDDRFLFNALPIHAEAESLLGFLLTFRSYSRVRNLVNRYAGMQARYTFADIAGRSAAIKKTVAYAKTIANSPSTILLTGESGTGKEVFAQSIHNASARKEGRFVAINCGAIAPSLIESELFGYVEGAFSGAKKGGQMGKFELADGGTLFLDEIGEMSMEMQVKLLRALQENAVTRVGGNTLIPVQARIIAATHKDLEAEVRENRFRLDLFYRLSVIPLNIPALRERPDDIIPLARHFLNLKSEALNKPRPELPAYLHQAMENYAWPGNIRELENFIEKTVILGRMEFHPAQQTPSPATEQKTPAETFIARPLHEIEKETIEKTITALHGNLTQVAKTLGISRNALYQKISRHNIIYSK